MWEVPLSEAFPSLYSIADSKGVNVAQVWEIEGDSGAWELDTVQQLLSLLASKKLMPWRSNKLFWKGS